MDTSPEANPELRARVRQQEVVAELGQQALESGDIDRLMRDASTAVAETLDNEYCRVLELLPDGNEVLLRQGVGWRDGLVGTATVPTDRDSQAGFTLLSEESVVVDDLDAEDRFSGPELLTSHDVVSGISVIIGSVEDPWGVLGTHATERREFTQDDATFVTNVANVLAAAIDRAEKEQSLSERERRFERNKQYTDDILAAIDDMFYVVDETGTFQRWNESLTDVTGYADSEIETMQPLEFIAEEEREAVANGIAEVFETGHARVEATVLTKDGERIPYEFVASRLEDPEGAPVLVGVGRDITERKAYQRELEESRHRYQTLVENFPNGAVGLVDEDLRYMTLGGDPLTENDITADELEGCHVQEALSPGLAEALAPRYEAALNGESSTLEYEYETEDRYTQYWTFPVRDDDGDVFAAMGMSQDITERIEREQALQESRNQLRALIELLPVAVFVAEDDGRIVEWNEAAEEIWGGEIVESDSVAEYDQYEGWWADTGEPVEPDEWALARALRGEEVTDPDVVEIEGFDGKRRTVLNHGMPVRDADGDVTRAVVTLTDITERKEYQRKLEESNERLEQFAYAASHDLQEPLRMVSSYLQLLESRYGDELDEDGEEFLGFAVDGADRMREMIESLLEYSRIETQGDPFESVDLNAVLEDSRRDLQFQIEENDAEITAEELPRVRGDESQLRQLFQNVLSNALVYSGDEPARAHVSCERAGPEWVISVRDEGIGIDPDDQERIFEVFQRLHAVDEHEGTGVGLALCRRIVERHGGDIWVESEPGEGATFSFTLPAADDRDK